MVAWMSTPAGARIVSVVASQRIVFEHLISNEL